MKVSISADFFSSLLLSALFLVVRADSFLDSLDCLGSGLGFDCCTASPVVEESTNTNRTSCDVIGRRPVQRRLDEGKIRSLVYLVSGIRDTRKLHAEIILDLFLKIFSKGPRPNSSDLTLRRNDDCLRRSAQLVVSHCKNWQIRVDGEFQLVLFNVIAEFV